MVQIEIKTRTVKNWLWPSQMCLKIVIPAVQHDPPHNLKMLTEMNNDAKIAINLLIVGTGLVAYHFLVENKWYHYYSQ